MDQPDTATRERLLARFGVPAQAEMIWLELLSDSDLTCEELSCRTGMSKAEIATAIASLAEAEFVRSAPTPTGVLTIDPMLAVEAHMARTERHMAEVSEEFADLRLMLPQLAAGYGDSRPSTEMDPAFEIVNDLEGIRRQICLAAEKVRAEIRSTEHAAFSLEQTGQRDAQFAVLDRGVRDRTIIASSVLADPVVFKEFREMQSHGHDARSLPDICNRMMIYDNDLLVVPVDPMRLQLGAMFIRQRSLIEALILMYDYLWTIACPIFTTSVDDSAPAGRPAQVLELMSLGFKDESIARALGLGVRSIRRDIAQLKTQLKVSTRAEVVAAAVRNGWL